MVCSNGISNKDNIIVQGTDNDNDNENNTMTTTTETTTSRNNNYNADISRFVGHLKLKKGWENYNDNIERFVRDCPKVELHVHFDGSFEFEVLWSTLQKKPELMTCFPVSTNPPWEPSKTLETRKLVQQCETTSDYRTLCTCRGKRSLNEMLNCFEMFLPVVRGNLELLEELAYDFVQRQWEQNIVYTEVRYSPQLLIDEMKQQSNIITGRTIIDVITRGLRRGCHDYGIVVNQILCGIAWRPDWAMETVEIANELKTDYPCAVVGIDIAAGEEHFNATEFPEIHKVHYKMIQRARELGLNITLHAGETTRAESLQNIKDAINEYGAHRIGHGYRMVRSVEIMDEIRDKKVHVEVCPTSSVETGGWIYENNNDDSNNGGTVTKKRDWKKHPCARMLQHNISFSLSSDDPAVFHTSLAWQYRIALVKIGFTNEQLIKTIVDSINAAFCSEKEKCKLRQMIINFQKSNSAEHSSMASSSNMINHQLSNSATKRKYIFKDRVQEPHETQ